MTNDELELKPCPFCGGGETRIEEITHWTGKRNVVISVKVRHFCVSGRSVIEFTRKTKELCTETWNTRANLERSDG